MKVSYSLKHATEKFDNPLNGLEVIDGLYADVCPHGTMFTVIMIGDYSHWFTNTSIPVMPVLKSNYNTKHDKRFALFPKGSTIIFTQDKI